MKLDIEDIRKRLDNNYLEWDDEDVALEVAMDDVQALIEALEEPSADRKSIVDWMRRTASQYEAAAELTGAMYAVTWRIIADSIEQEADKKPAERREDERG